MVFVSKVLLRQPIKLAVFGSGPSAFYLSQRLLNQLDKGVDDSIHMYERLPVPFGLVRYGVAPDHPDVKNCINSFSRAAEDSRFQFFGGISVGSHRKIEEHPKILNVPLEDIAKHYTHLAFSYGASRPTHLANVKGSSGSSDKLSSGVYSASEFVGWYNGHPDYMHLHDKIVSDLKRAKKVAIIGQGNVGLDIARMLVTTDYSKLSTTDIPIGVLDALKNSTVKHVDLIGRRGLSQVAFTAKETREMMHLPHVAMKSVDSNTMDEVMKEGDASGDKEWRAKKRILGLLRDGSECKLEDADRSWALKFLLSPAEYIGKNDTLSSIKFGVNKLTKSAPSTEVLGSKPATQSPPRILATPTDQSYEEDYDLVIESIGYRSEQLGDIPFDSRKGVILNTGGRVIDENGINIPNVYSTGWASRGPVGVIASTMYDSYSVADTILQDIHNGDDPAPSTELNWAPSIKSPKEGVPPVVDQGAIKWEDWRRINDAEVANGKQLDKIREKFLSIDEMFNVLKK
ncbi:nucleotide-binding domain-containing protein [Wallemia mellicola CBS 633.66]|uniref:NADPH:adrenodoxin oxidoreductase, mitochondrial n=2 Tax=Wallemia mellicola TaxID=1708541 RepID=A0A4T0LWV8_9BASI|nr:nucleotide-binding domain-containing protein [Wallemia mellicola CBS 633.66]TIB70997.1 hypothetical protein E3Q24_02598 [Wallemia mellicola]EIM23082.1 nucleotide-binding domain-containing protein [Wallemia mellicola CBS 633.66]TIB74376.1 hypothetical protein E3Q23_02677 [Wallemia mellicola]TIB94455.1 nucleotide-binding domain-containing protein [Wallemia mellicola]TIB98887.1 nucleotide-binding domain-containing protein [Wallemia mellicola]|eukprot:XP_006957115.1 nucleotide-binding domain-containing protein [Wallemia mellicola CBS 633.66]